MYLVPFQYLAQKKWIFTGLAGLKSSKKCFAVASLTRLLLLKLCVHWEIKRCGIMCWIYRTLKWGTGKKRRAAAVHIAAWGSAFRLCAGLWCYEGGFTQDWDKHWELCLDYASPSHPQVVLISLWTLPHACLLAYPLPAPLQACRLPDQVTGASSHQVPAPSSLPDVSKLPIAMPIPLALSSPSPHPPSAPFSLYQICFLSFLCSSQASCPSSSHWVPLL